MAKWRLDPGQIEVVDEAVAAVLRRKTPAERIAMVSQGWTVAVQWVRAAVWSQHPGWDEARVAAEVRRRMSRGAA